MMLTEVSCSIVPLPPASRRGTPVIDFAYNIESPVGPGQPNERASVAQVQRMLGAFVRQYGDMLGLPLLPVTGEMDHQTGEAIVAFQRWLQWSPWVRNVPVDGILRPFEDPASASSALLALNRIWASLEPAAFRLHRV